MASGLFTLLDDIAALMDDVVVTTKLAAHKTAGILGDDLAVNAEQATGFSTSRELPVIWAITKGSLLNKLIIIPVVLILNIFLPIAIKVLLVLGGLYLGYEGVEKIIEFFFHRKHKKNNVSKDNAHKISNEVDEKVAEKTKVKSAIITDFVLSVEIIIIALSTVLHETLMVQTITVTIIAIIATVGVYGLVALIVRLDDMGIKLVSKSKGKGFLNRVGLFLIQLLPWIIKSFAVIGTIALIYVSGQIFVHQIEFFHHLLPNVPLLLKEMMYGIIAGLLVFGLLFIVKRIFKLN